MVGDGFELALRQSIGLLKGTPEAMLDHPVAIIFWVLTLLGVLAILRRKKTNPDPAEAAAE